MIVVEPPERAERDKALDTTEQVLQVKVGWLEVAKQVGKGWQAGKGRGVARASPGAKSGMPRGAKRHYRS